MAAPGQTAGWVSLFILRVDTQGLCLLLLLSWEQGCQQGTPAILSPQKLDPGRVVGPPFS